jgi:hypothetical protein
MKSKMELLSKDLIGIIVSYVDHETTSSWFKAYKLNGFNVQAMNVLQCAMDCLHKESKNVKERLLILTNELDEIDIMRRSLNV